MNVFKKTIKVCGYAFIGITFTCQQLEGMQDQLPEEIIKKIVFEHCGRRERALLRQVDTYCADIAAQADVDDFAQLSQDERDILWLTLQVEGNTSERTQDLLKQAGADENFAYMQECSIQ